MVLPIGEHPLEKTLCRDHIVGKPSSPAPLQDSLRSRPKAEKQRWAGVDGGEMLRCGILAPLQKKSSNGGDLASTWVAKPKVHAEVQCPRKTHCKTIVANDDNYALAA